MALSAQKERFAQALVKALPGLNINVARAWTAAEVGQLNTLGITTSAQPTRPAAPGVPGVYKASNGQYLYSYYTPEEGAQAAAEFLRRSKLYTGIISSLTSTNPNVQATAIAQSPFHLGPTGLKRAGGTDPYYRRIFEQFGLKVGGVGTTPAPVYDQPQPAEMLGAWGDIIKLPEGKILDNADVEAMLTALDKAGYFSDPVSGAAARQVTGDTLRASIGKPWNKELQDSLQAQFGQHALNAGGLGDAVGGLPNAIFGTVGRMFLIVGGLLCIGVGIWIVLHATPKSTDPALLKVLEGGKTSGAAVA